MKSCLEKLKSTFRGVNWFMGEKNMVHGGDVPKMNHLNETPGTSKYVHLSNEPPELKEMRCFSLFMRLHRSSCGKQGRKAAKTTQPCSHMRLGKNN